MLYDEADLYDTLLPASAAELSYYSNLARNHPTAALELACGSGQSIIPVASLGLSATGLISHQRCCWQGSAVRQLRVRKSSC
jgi:hypothetical protein